MRKMAMVIGFLFLAGSLFAQQRNENLKPCYFFIKPNVSDGIKTDEKYTWIAFASTANNRTSYYFARLDNPTPMKFAEVAYFAMPLSKFKDIPVFDISVAITSDEVLEKPNLAVLGRLLWVKEQASQKEGSIWLVAFDFTAYPEQVSYYNELMRELK
jgi:hypothetical protein